MRKDASTTKFGGFSFTPETCSVRSRSGKTKRLRPEVSAILAALSVDKGKVVTKEALYKGICERGIGFPPEPKIVDVQVCNLRRALDDLAPNGGDHVITEWGQGYRLSDRPQARKKALQCIRGAGDRGLLKRLYWICNDALMGL